MFHRILSHNFKQLNKFQPQLNKITVVEKSTYLLCKNVAFHQRGLIFTKFNKTSINFLPNYVNVRLKATETQNEKQPKSSHLNANPKNVLHNIYNVVSDELKQPLLKVNPSYKLVSERNKKQTWICTYHLTWPEDIKFSFRDGNKKNASNKAAMAALNWLKEKNKITEQGSPIIYDKDDFKEMKMRNVTTLNLNQTVIENLNSINEKFKNEFEVKLNEKTDANPVDLNEVAKVISESDNVNLFNVKSQRFLGLNVYKSKEKVVLPIAAYKEDFKNLLNSKRVVIVKGEPGCGKSTRVPQYVLESWAEENDTEIGEVCRIAVTQPRRIAAISLAERVAKERDEQVGHIIGHQVRLNSKFDKSTGRILYCTTGILLRHFQSDPSLSQFSHIILDEAHERDVNTDLLMCLLKTAMSKNDKLKLIVMSATIDTDMFSEYYDGAPVFQVPGFAYPVKSYFLDDLRFKLPKTSLMCSGPVPSVTHEEVVHVLGHIHQTKPEGAILCFLPGWQDISHVNKLIPRQNDLVVYCLHSRLRDSDQWKIFSRPPPGVRKIVLATNIAETSVTIDDVVYVVDTGIQKEQKFDLEKGVNCIDSYWISKASAIQRRGRAGRVQPGECFHLYYKDKYEGFPEFSQPEIKKMSLTKIVLDSKVYSNNMNAIEFMHNLPTPPEDEATKTAINELKELELLDENECLTPLGRTLSNFQLEPKLSKAMVNAVVYKCVTPVVDIATLFSSETELFVSGLMDKERVKEVKSQFCSNSDHLALMRILEKWLEVCQSGRYNVERFCSDLGLVQHKIDLIRKIRQIHFEYLHNGLRDAFPISDEFSDNDEMVKAVLFSGVNNILLRRNWDVSKGRLKNNVTIFLTNKNHKATISGESVNFKRRSFPNNILIYINETRSNIRRTTVVRECSLISDLSILLFSNKSLIIDELKNSEENSDQILLTLQGTNVRFFCDKELAEKIVECKRALNLGYKYFIKQLTENGEYSREMNKCWNDILSSVSKILYECSVRK